MSALRHALLVLVVLAAAVARADGPRRDYDTGPFFYHPREFGSDSHFNPFSSFVNWSGDSLQVPENFDTRDLSDRLDEVVKNLTHPWDAIDEEGGWGDFVHHQILPIHFDDLEGSLELVPNYALHLLGGGMVYRKNVEWLRAHGVRFPRTIAATSGMAAEILQEVIEKKTTTADDEVADVLLFRPLGMWLFSSDRFARFAARRMGLLEWPHQAMFDTAKDEFVNVGQNFVVRPRFRKSSLDRTGPRNSLFVYFGITALVGASHPVSDRDSFSWGVGGAVTRAKRDDALTRESVGFFWDRDDSLMASLIVNGSESLKVRANVYPGVLGRGRWSPGLFIGVDDDGEAAGGITFRVTPIGLATGAARHPASD